MQFEFATAGRIVFGSGMARQAGSLAREFGRNALLVTGGSQAYIAPVLDSLAEAGVEFHDFRVRGEPTTDLAAEGVELARRLGCDLVIGCGGGSALDAGKAISILAANPGEIFDYLEVIGRGKSFTRPPLPCIAIPTTAGTGTEATRNAVITAPAQRVKVSLRALSMLPRLALVDPDLTLSLPPAATASSGLDALTQLIEPFVSTKANPFTDAICREGIQRAAGSLRRAYQDGSDRSARQDMCVASLFSGIALANAKLGAVHGFAAPLGGEVEAPHGVICARLLPLVMEVNVRALQTRQPQNPALQRYAEVARLLTGDPHATAMDGAAWVDQLHRDLHIPGLAAFGLHPGLFEGLVEKASRASSMQGNPIQLTPRELHAILERSL